MRKSILLAEATPLRKTRNWRYLFRGERIGYLYILPSLIFLLAILGFPILYSIYMSFQDYTLKTMVSGKISFIGFQNYQTIFSDPNFSVALGHSITFTILSIIFQFTIGFALALLFVRAFPLNGVLRGILLSGWQIPSVVVGTIFLWMFNLDYGLINFVLQSLHLVQGKIGWLINPPLPLWTVIITNIWLGIPFNVILLTAGIAGLPEEIYEAATVDGATAFGKFTNLTIPLLKPTILATLMLGLIYTLRVFDIIWIMTGGGPGNATEVLPTYAYRLSFIRYTFEFGQSAATSVVMLVMLFVIAIFYVRNAVTETM